jgi:hypothetical protein
MAYKMNGFSGFGNSPILKKQDIKGAQNLIKHQDRLMKEDPEGYKKALSEAMGGDSTYDQKTDKITTVKSPAPKKGCKCGSKKCKC